MSEPMKPMSADRLEEVRDFLRDDSLVEVPAVLADEMLAEIDLLRLERSLWIGRAERNSDDKGHRLRPLFAFEAGPPDGRDHRCLSGRADRSSTTG
jgi:hypothetical protein